MRRSRLSIGVILIAAGLFVAIARKEAAQTTQEAAPAAVAEGASQGPPTASPAHPAKVAERSPKPPRITDSKVKILVHEARIARKNFDIAAAILKVGEAEELAPEEPNILYEKALIYEEMAAYDKRLKELAVETYQAILKLGKKKAGILYDIAAKKLADGK